MLQIIDLIFVWFQEWQTLRVFEFDHNCIFTGEADIVAAHVEQLVQAGIPPQDIAVIAPYNLQV